MISNWSIPQALPSAEVRGRNGGCGFMAAFCFKKSGPGAPGQVADDSASPPDILFFLFPFLLQGTGSAGGALFAEGDGDCCPVPSGLPWTGGRRGLLISPAADIETGKFEDNNFGNDIGDRLLPQAPGQCMAGPADRGMIVDCRAVIPG